MSGFTGNLRSNTDRAARVQRLKAAVAERKQQRERREAGRQDSRDRTVSVQDTRKRRSS